MNYAVILSGGIGTRMRDDGFPKQYLTVFEKPILVYALEVFEACPRIDQIVVVASHTWHEQIKQWLAQYGITKCQVIAQAGDSRQESVMNGLLACVGPDTTDRDNVLIHEAVRPLVSQRILADCMDALQHHDCCIPVLPIHDTTYVSLNGTQISQLTDRDHLFRGQAPEGFKLLQYLEMSRQLPQDQRSSIRGSTELAYMNGLDIQLIAGETANFKLTNPGDLELFQAYLTLRQK